MNVNRFLEWAVAKGLRLAERHARREAERKVPTRSGAVRAGLMANEEGDVRIATLPTDMRPSVEADIRFGFDPARDGSFTVLRVRPEGQMEIVGRDLRPVDQDRAAASYARAMAEASYERPRRPLDPEGAAVMVMHVLAPDDGGPMRTACCGRLLEELPATEGVYRHSSVGRATCRDSR